MTRARDVADRAIVANAVGATELDLTDTYAFTGTVTGAGSNILERLAMLCDGEDYTVSSGTYTPTNVTAAAGTSSTFSTLGGSAITYTPPSGATGVL